jgi:hypothetical protein
VVATCAQVAPFHSQVSAKTVVPSKPPKSTVTPRSLSNASWVERLDGASVVDRCAQPAAQPWPCGTQSPPQSA